MKYKSIEGIDIADVAYEVYGESLEQLFKNAAEALEQTMVDVAAVKPSRDVKCKISNVKLNDLLLDFLNELVFLKDSKQLLFSQFDIKLSQLEARGYQLNATCWGEKIDPQRHHLRTDVKAVTLHKFRLSRGQNKYKLIMVFDI